MSKNIRALSARQRDDKTLFEALTATAEQTGSPSAEQLRDLSKQRLVSSAALLGTSSFYDFLHENNRGKRAWVCNGTSCMLSGRQGKARHALSGCMSENEIGEVACLGHCYHAGAYWQGEQTFDAESSPETGSAPHSIPYHKATTQSLFTAEISDLDVFYESVLPEPEKVVAELTASRLRGRGGAGFHFADKLNACANTPTGQKYIVCNGDEGDPGAFSDRYLMEEQPHRVLAGMLAAAHVVGADTGYLYIRAEYPLAQQRVREAIDAFEQTTVYTKNRLQFHIIRGAGSYICGEETALLNSIEACDPRCGPAHHIQPRRDYLVNPPY